MHFLSFIGKNSNNIYFCSALTLGLKKDDMVFMPLLSTLARLFWAAVIFLGGWKRKINSVAQPQTGCWVEFEQRESRFFFPLRVERSPERKTRRTLAVTERRIVPARITFNWNIYTDFFLYTHFPRKVCTVEFGVILSSLHRSVGKFPFLPKEGRRDAFEDKKARNASELKSQRPPAGRNQQWLARRGVTISDTRLKKSARATTLLKVLRSAEVVQGRLQ